MISFCSLWAALSSVRRFVSKLNDVLYVVMQCGFAFLEAGSVRSKNTTNILIKNLLDSCQLLLIERQYCKEHT